VRVAVLGQGSIGRRHAAIVRALGHDVTGYDTRADALSAEGVRRASSEIAAVEDAGAVIVASPPSEHLRQARLALEAGAHTLVEKPAASSAEGVVALAALARERGLVLTAAMNLRFHPGVCTVRHLIAKGAVGRPLRVSIWCGSWLPGWRPGVDYRDTYSAQCRLGGGVLLDAIHELDYAIWMLGPVVRVRGLLTHESSLGLDVEDIAMLVLEHATGTVTSVTLDYLDRAYHRGCRVVGEEGTIHWSWEDEAVVLLPAGGEPKRLAATSDVDPTYHAQLEVFLDAATRGNATTPRATAASSFEEAAAALAVADAARLASARGIAVKLATRCLALRPAQREDAENLLRWRNDPTTRAASFNSEEVSPTEHAAWLERVLVDPDRRLLIATEDHAPVGQLRLDRLAANTVEVHIALAPEARGHGLATELLKLAAQEHAPALGAARLLARVKPDNEPSRHSFAKAGFRVGAKHAEEWWLELTPPHGHRRHGEGV